MGSDTRLHVNSYNTNSHDKMSSQDLVKAAGSAVHAAVEQIISNNERQTARGLLQVLDREVRRLRQVTRLSDAFVDDSDSDNGEATAEANNGDKGGEDKSGEGEEAEGGEGEGEEAKEADKDMSDKSDNGDDSTTTQDGDRSTSCTLVRDTSTETTSDSLDSGASTHETLERHRYAKRSNDDGALTVTACDKRARREPWLEASVSARPWPFMTKYVLWHPATIAEHAATRLRSQTRFGRQLVDKDTEAMAKTANFLFTFVFQPTAQGVLIGLVQEYVDTTGDGNELGLALGVETTLQQIKGMPLVLSNLVRQWAQAVTVDSIQSGTVQGFNRRRTWACLSRAYNVRLVQQWDELIYGILDGQRVYLTQYLANMGYPSGSGARGQDLRTAALSFLTSLLNIPNRRALTSRLSQWRPISVLVKVLGPGILPFVSMQTARTVRSLWAVTDGADDDGDDGGEAEEGEQVGSDSISVFTHDLQRLNDGYPGIKTVLDQLNAALVDPVLNHKTLPNSRALALARKHKLGSDTAVYIDDFLEDEEAVRDDDIIVVDD